MIFAITMAVLLPNEPEWLEVFRAKHTTYEPHVTLVQPRIITAKQHGEIQELLAEYMATKSFLGHHITFRFSQILENIQSSDSDTDLCLMLGLDQSEQLTTMQRELVELVKGYPDYIKSHRQEYEKNFRPHLTLAVDLDATSYAEILKELPEDYAVEGIVEEVQLLSKEDPEQLQPQVVAYHL
jgi:2'-5' RNA ligase